jgi:hypothetical protein
MSFNIDFSKATKTFIKNKKIIQDQFKGELYSLELNQNELNDIFDKSASTDILYKHPNGLILGIAMRINFNKKNYECITIRHTRFTGTETEYIKTIKAIKYNAINSCIGIQIDVDDKHNLIRGIVYDRYALFNFIEENKNILITKNLEQVYDGNTYFKITYNDIIKFNIKYKVFYNKTN